MTAFNDIIDTSLPDGGDDPVEADDNMRRIQGGFQELLDVDHLFEKTGSVISGADSGEHRKVTLRVGSAPSAVANKGFVYAKDVSAKAELFYIDEDGNEVQLTSGGKILSASLDMKDQDNMSSNSATHAATQQSIKAYADAVGSAKEDALVTQATASIFGARTTVDTASGALAHTEIYKAQSDGFLTVNTGDQDNRRETKILSDSSATPSVIIARSSDDLGRNVMTVPILKDDYFQITIQTDVPASIYWVPIGTGGLVKQ